MRARSKSLGAILRVFKRRENEEEDDRLKGRQMRQDFQKSRQTDEPPMQTKFRKGFEKAVKNWPSLKPRTLKHTQGIVLTVVQPYAMRGENISVVCRNEPKYSVRIGYGEDCAFDPRTLLATFEVREISSRHARLHFQRMKDRSSIFIEDDVSLNGTFMLRRAFGTYGPFMEKEVTEMCDLEGVQYLRFGQTLVVALTETNIHWDVDDESDEEPAPDILGEDAQYRALLEMQRDGWYFPLASKKWD
eukprot:c32804_g1_i1.p1 GENE.c32804_g1_i1~~c32804_g1_i1.p1  ORF type:complete len:246 (-),score=41.61 c32804_g1_i1:423-1160(-)